MHSCKPCLTGSLVNTESTSVAPNQKLNPLGRMTDDSSSSFWKIAFDHDVSEEIVKSFKDRPFTAAKIQEISSSICFVIAIMFLPSTTPTYFIVSLLVLTFSSTMYHIFDHAFHNSKLRPLAEFADTVSIINIGIFTLTVVPLISFCVTALIIMAKQREKGKYIIYTTSFVNTTYMGFKISYLTGIAVIFFCVGSFVFFDFSTSLFPFKPPFRWNRWSVWGWHIGQTIYLMLWVYCLKSGTHPLLEEPW